MSETQLNNLPKFRSNAPALRNYSLFTFSITGNIWGQAVSNREHLLIYSEVLNFDQTPKYICGALFAADMEIGPLELYVSSCQSRTLLHNLSSFKV